jgi:hypothetical protein
VFDGDSLTHSLNQFLYKHNKLFPVKENCYYYGWNLKKFHVTLNSYFSDVSDEIMFLAVCSCYSLSSKSHPLFKPLVF